MNNSTIKSQECSIISESITSSDIKPLNEKDTRCAPNQKFENGSCIPLHILVEMAKAYNKDNPGNEIKLSSTHETVNPEKYKRYLVKQFKNKLIKQCNNQKCWTKQGFIENLQDKIKKELKEDVFRPKGPNGKFEWLNTSNIIMF